MYAFYKVKSLRCVKSRELSCTLLNDLLKDGTKLLICDKIRSYDIFFFNHVVTLKKYNTIFNLSSHSVLCMSSVYYVKRHYVCIVNRQY